MRKMVNECYGYAFMPTAGLLRPINRERIRIKAIKCRMIEKQSPELIEDDDRLKKRRVSTGIVHDNSRKGF